MLSSLQRALTRCVSLTIASLLFVGFVFVVTACTAVIPFVSPTSTVPAQPTDSGPVSTATVAQPQAPVTVGPQPGVTATVAAGSTIAAPTPAPKSATATVAAAKPPAAPTGKIAYSVVTGEQPKFHTIWIANADGSNQHQILTHAWWPALSPDGTRIAYFGRPEGGSEGLYLADIGGGNRQLIFIHPGVCCINWSRDGNWVVFAQSGKASQPGGPLVMIKMDGAYKTISNVGVEGNGPVFSPDGKQIVYSGCLPNTNTCGLLAVAASGGTPRSITKDNGGNADWSARGLVYQATDSANNPQVFFVNVDGSGKKQLTTGKKNDGQPTWSRDGGSIFWRSDQNGTAWSIYVMNADGSNHRKLIDNVVPDPALWGWESLSVSQ
jgi:hypothetical protein